MIFIILFFSVNSTYALKVNSSSAILMESGTGKVLYEKNSNVQRPMASTSKIMTYLLTMDAVKSGKIGLDDKVRVSKNAASTQGSSYKLKENDILTVKELLESMMIISANDSAVVLSEHIEGSVGKFSVKMNDKAKSLGLKSAYFVNPNGMPLQNKDQNKISAKDLALLSKHVINQYGDHLFKITSQKEFNGTYKKFSKKSTNKLLETTSFTDGLKTGYTDLAGHCLVSVTKALDGKENRLISIVLGGKTAKERFDDSQNMMEYGLSDFHLQIVLEKGEVLGYSQTELNKYIPIEIISNSSISILSPKNVDLSKGKEIIYDSYVFNNDVLDGREIKSVLRLKDGREIEGNLIARRGISVFIDDMPIIFDKARPIVNDSTTLIPLRKVTESLGATVQWDGVSKTITGKKDDKTFILTIDSKVAILNGEFVQLLTPPLVIEGNTMVPARFIAESLGMEVKWEQDINSVKIYSNYGL